MKVILTIIFSLFLINTTLAKNLPEACVKNIRKTFGLRVGAAVGMSLTTVGTATATVFAPFLAGVNVLTIAGAVYASTEAHKYRKTHAILNTIQSDNVGPTDWTFKKFAKKLGMTPIEALKISKQNRQFFCTGYKGADFVLYDKILLKMNSLRAIPIIDQILTECSPQTIRGILKNKGLFSPERYKRPITDKLKNKSLGNEKFLGVKLKGRENRLSWIYHKSNNFSDPLFHTISDYQYFIHMIRSTHSVGTHEYSFNQSSRYLNSLKKTSLSLVNEKDTIPFMDGIGLLIQAKPETIIATNKNNMGSDHIDFKKLNGKFPIGTPASVFNKRTPNSRNNEVVSVKGSKLIAYLLLADENTNRPIYEIYESDKASALLKSCKRWNLPVVLLKRTNSKKLYP